VLLAAKARYGELKSVRAPKTVSVAQAAS